MIIIIMHAGLFIDFLSWLIMENATVTLLIGVNSS